MPKSLDDTVTWCDVKAHNTTSAMPFPRIAGEGQRLGLGEECLNQILQWEKLGRELCLLAYRSLVVGV